MKRSRESRLLALILANVIVLSFLFPTNADPQNSEAEIKAPGVAWDRTFGGPSIDYGLLVQQTSDGGYILAGRTDSFGAGGADIWLIKTDAEGKKQWDRTFGGSGSECANSVQQTSDGGYILIGTTYSFGAGEADIWLIKTDAEGEKQWDCTFGGPDHESAGSVQQTSDGGYILVGRTASFGAGKTDIWLIKTDAEGKKQWDCTFGGPDYEYGLSVQQTSDGGYIVAGTTYSFGAGGSDIWLIKTDAEGKKQWDCTFGGPSFDGPDYDYGVSVQQTSDGGYILAGTTDSFGAGGADVWLIKTDAEGEKQWDRTFGGPGYEYAGSVQQTSDNGYILSGKTDPFGASGFDAWLIKTDAEGKKQWDRIFDGPDYESASSVQQTSDGGYILTGRRNSSGAGGRYSDAWLIKLEGEIPTLVENQEEESDLPKAFVLFQNYPNPFNSATEINFILPNTSYVTLEVFNALGRKIETLVDGKRKAGKYLATWDATNFPTGIYFYHMETEGFTRTMKMLLMK